MISFGIKGFHTTSSQHALLGLNLVFRTILIFYSVRFILIQVNLPREEIPTILTAKFPNRRITQKIKEGNESC